VQYIQSVFKMFGHTLTMNYLLKNKKKRIICKNMSGNQWSSSLIERLDLKINTLTM